MNKSLTVSCVQLHWAKKIEYNLEKAVHYLKLAKKEDSQVVLFPEANLTSYYFPYIITIDTNKIIRAIDKICQLV